MSQVGVAKALSRRRAKLNFLRFVSGQGVFRLIEKAVGYVARVTGSELIASALLFGAPATLALAVAWSIYRVPLFPYDVCLALLWLALAPYLILTGDRLLGRLIEHYGDADGLRGFAQAVHRRWRTYFPVVSIPLATSAYLSVLRFSTFPLPVKILITAISSMTLFLAGIGFWGVVVVLHGFGSVESSAFPFIHGHDDKIGGLRFLYSCTNIGMVCFSTGALFLPMTREIGLAIAGRNHAFLHSLAKWIPPALLVLIVGTIIVGFVGPAALFHRILLDKQRERVTAIRRRLAAITQSGTGATGDLPRFLGAYIEFTLEKEEIEECRTWPFDHRALTLLVESLASPALVAGVNLAIKLGIK